MFWLEEADREHARRQLNSIQAASFPNMEERARNSMIDSLEQRITAGIEKEKNCDYYENGRRKYSERQERIWAENRKALVMRIGRKAPENG